MRAIIVSLLCLLAADYTVGQVNPEPRPDPTWIARHESFVNNTFNNPGTQIIFYGDSITDFWTNAGSAIFNRHYAPIGVANYGIAGDSTQHVLWRITNGEVYGLNPRLVVLKIGTNNLGPHNNAGIAAGVLRIVRTLREQLPNAKVLLLGILPRNGAALFDRIVAINSIIQSYHDGQNVFFFNMFDQFRSGGVWGVVPPELFNDGLHLTTAGYQLWADTMNPLFNHILSLP